jgi:hypothetical protein
VTLSNPDAETAPSQLANVGDNRFFGTATLGSVPSARLMIVVRRGGADVSVPVDWFVPVAAAPASTHSFARLVSVPSTVLLTSVLAVGAWWSLLSRRRWQVDV